jgi:hypothetical membrane protein
MSRKRQIALSLCGVAAPVVFSLLVILAGTQYAGYSHMTQAISELGGVDAARPLIQNANFFIAGVLIVAFTIGLHRNLGTRRSAFGASLVGAFGLVCVAHAFLPCDAGCEFVSTTGLVHNVTGLAGFLSAIAGVFLVSRTFRDDPAWKSYRLYSVMTAVAGLASLVLWIALAKVARIHMFNGVLQRVFAATIFVWIEVVAVRLFLLSRRAAPISAAAGREDWRSQQPTLVRQP